MMHTCVALQLQHAVAHCTPATCCCRSCYCWQIYGDEPSVDGCPLAEGELGGLQTGTMFLGLQTYYK
jgi:hypothetical protein